MELQLIGIDVDGVVANLHTEWLSRYNRDYHDNLQPADLYKWEIEEFVKPECGKKIFNYLADPGIYDFVKPFEGTREAVQELAQIGEVVFISSCHSPEVAQAKQEWLGKHMGISSWLYPCYQGESKNKVGADILLDDYVVNVEEFKGWGILINQPHNRRVGCTQMRVNHLRDSIGPIKTRIHHLTLQAVS